MRRRELMMHRADQGRFGRLGMAGGKRWFKDGDGADGAAAWDGFVKALPEDLRGDPALKDFKEPVALAKAYRDTKALVGASLRPPGPEADGAAHKEFAERLAKTTKGIVYLPDDPKARSEVEPALWAALGRPEKVADYQAEGVELAAEQLEALRAEAAEAGLTKAQFGKLAMKAAAAAKTLAGQRAEAHKALRESLGADPDAKMREIAFVAEKTGAPRAVREAIAGGQIDKETAAYFLAVGKQLGIETREVAGQRSSGAPTVSVSEAKLRSAEILKNPAFYGTDEAAAALREKLVGYQAIVNPDLVER